jgi:phage terminase large subunit-like protein
MNELVGLPCWGGVDLSSKTDLSAFVLAFPPNDGCARWRLLCWFWTPDVGLEAREQAARAPYRQWVDEGHLIAVEGTRIDQGAIQTAILEARDRFDVRLVGADPWNAEKLVGDVNEVLGDDRMVVIDQTYLQLSGPSKDFEAAVSAGTVDCGGNPVLSWMASNVVVAVDANENIKPTKDPRKTRGRIDGITAAIMATKLAMADRDEPEIVPEVRSLTW